MTIHTQSFSFSSRALTPVFRPRFATFAAAVALGAGALFGSAGSPAFAADRPAWEEGCSYKVPSGIPGLGLSMAADMCARLRFCQSMTDQGKDMSRMACIGFAPAARPTDRRL